MSQRQLPPVRISFVADTKQFDKAADDVLKKVQAVANAGVRISGARASANAVKTAMQTAVALMQRQLQYAAQQLVSTIHTVQGNGRAARTAFRDSLNVVQTALENAIRRMVAGVHTVRSGTRNINRVLRQATDMVLHYLLINIRRMVTNVHNVRAAGSASVNRTLRNAVDVVLHSLLRYIRRLVVNVHNVRFSTAQVNRAIRDAIDVAAHAIISSIRASFTAASAALQNRPIYVPMIRAGLRRIIRDTMRSMLQTIETSMAAAAAGMSAILMPAINRFTRDLGRSMIRIINVARQFTRDAITSADLPMAGGGGRADGGRASGGRAGGGGGGGEGFGSIGARADLYMHTMALRNMTRYSASVFDTYMNYQDLNIALEAFTGGATSAARVMKEIQDYAIQSPYDTLSLGDAARNMMAYGQSSDETLKIMKMVGDVAGGNTKRFDLLMYAMSQITSLGRLQGNELRQLTEQGFNPLVYWANKTKTANETMAQAMKRMYKAKQDGLVTSDMVIEALKAETSAGGRFHDMAKRLNDSLRGLGNQVRETFIKLSNVFLQYLEPSAKSTLKYILELQNKVLKFATEPKNFPLIARIAHIAKNAFLALAAFHLLGAGIAGLSWWGRSVTIVLTRLRSVAFIPLMVVSRLLRLGLFFLNGTLFVLRIATLASQAAVVILRASFLAAAAAARALSVASFALSGVFAIIQLGAQVSLIAAIRWTFAASAAGMFRLALIAQRAVMVTVLAVTYATTFAAIGLTRAWLLTRIAVYSTTRSLVILNGMLRSLNALVIATRSRIITLGLAHVFLAVRTIFGTAAMVMFTAALRASEAAARTFQAAGWALQGMMVALRVASMLAWLAMAAPVVLVVAAIGATALAVWGVVQAITGAGGIVGAFTYAWESVKWFATAAGGFMSNFAENMQIIGKYIYDNWKTMLYEMGDITLRVLGAMPNNFLVALRTGTRLIVAFGAWLGNYLPSAFEYAYNKVYEFLADFFTNILKAGQKVWEYITTPSKWGKTEFEKEIFSFIETMKTDAEVATTQGIGEAAQRILAEEAANLRTGLEGFQSSLPELKLNLKLGELNLPGMPGPDIQKPEAPTGGESLGGDAWKATEAMSADSGAYRKFMAEFSMKQMGVSPEASPQVKEQKKTNTKMDKLIEAFNRQSVNFFPAEVGGVP